ncbi:unnamed protein product [Mycena citricolor]|uniref:Uncharacterized protein n=1 Tax=Mycena citricolor TaxID=2018698 RepID=A0AAD2HK97_9AGAR|nr:unnamed protein product [Mycena citricolor]
MATNLPSTPILPDDQKLSTDGSNWSNFKDGMFNMARGCGLEGYLTGAIVLPTSFVQSAIGYTLLNSQFPSPDEWALRDGWVATMLYQNIKDPRSHDISGSDTAHQMWTSLIGKFNRSTELLIGIRMERLRDLRLKDTRYLPGHIDKLIKLCADVHGIGGLVTDQQMCTIILNSPLKEEFGASLIVLQTFNQVQPLIANLRDWWEMVWLKKINEEDTKDSTKALTIHAPTNPGGATTCTACGGTHHQRVCWARGGGKEGQAPSWWKAPRGKEPNPMLVAAHRQAKEARQATSSNYPNTHAMLSPPVNYTQAIPTTTTAAFSNPITTYALATHLNSDELDVEDHLLPF